MRSFDKFKRKMSLSGGSLRNERIMDSRMLLNETFADDASFALGVYFWELGKLGKESYINDEALSIRIYNRRYSAAQGVTMKFQTPVDLPVNVGDVVYNSKEDEYLICTECHNINDVHWQGKFTLCNWILKWQDKDGNIVEYPCYDINATQYNSGEQSNRQFTIGSSQHIILLPYDKNTIALKTPQRFFLSRDEEHPVVYIITQNDSTSYNFGKRGIVRITVLENAFDIHKDRIDLGICDYWDPIDEVVDEAGTSTLPSTSAPCKSTILYKNSELKSGGDYQTFTAAFFDDDDNEMADVAPEWKIICPFYESLQVIERDRSIDIAIDDDAYIDEEFKIMLSDSNGNASSSLIVRIESLL